MSKPRQFLTLPEVIANVPLVHRIYERRSNTEAAEMAVVMLATVNEALAARVMALESIAPRKITVAGQTMIWRCPDELVPDQMP